jgi:TRAP transporter TAXI family solute receptor
MVALLGALIMAGACRHTAVVPQPRTVLRLTTGTPGARFQPLGQALARAYTAAFPAIDFTVHESAGSVANIEVLQRSEADIGLAYADVAYMAYVGRLTAPPPGAGEIRGIAVLELAPVHLVVRAGLSIRDASELRGTRIAVGPTGSGSALTAQIVLLALGVDSAAARVEPLKYNEAAARLTAGSLDAMFVTGGDPVDSVRAAMAAGARLIPLAGPAIERLRREYPFFRTTVVRGGMYAGQPAPVATIGVDSLLVCRRGLDEATAHDLTRQFFAALPSLPMLSFMDVDEAPATPIPLHEGAARYYRERELSR